MKLLMKCLKLIIIVPIILFFLSGCNKNSDSKNNQENADTVEFSRTSITNNLKENTNDDKNIDNDNDNDDRTNNEVEISSFYTPLKSGVANRITNIKLTCGKINERVFKNGETFSFNQIVGPCTAEEGYKKAEIYVNKKIQFAYGGGNCQVSTTLYNAALAVPGIEITERHEHNGRPVDYIEDGKDATVSYNTLDLKFLNNTGSSIKLYTWCDDVNVYAKIFRLEE